MTLPERAAAASGAARSRSTIRDGARHGTLGPHSSRRSAVRVVRRYTVVARSTRDRPGGSRAVTGRRCLAAMSSMA